MGGGCLRWLWWLGRVEVWGLLPGHLPGPLDRILLGSRECEAECDACTTLEGGIPLVIVLEFVGFVELFDPLLKKKVVLCQLLVSFQLGEIFFLARFVQV